MAMGQALGFSAPSGSNRSSEPPSSRLPSNGSPTPMASTSQLPRSPIPQSSRNGEASTPKLPLICPSKVLTSSNNISSEISTALTHLFTRTEALHRQSTLYNSLPPTEVWKSVGFTPTSAQLAYREDIKTKSEESEKEMKVVVEGVLEKLRAEIAAEVKEATSHLGMTVAGHVPADSRAVARVRGMENANDVVVLKRLSTLENLLREERIAREAGQELVVQQTRLQGRQDQSISLSRMARLEDQAETARRIEMENLRKAHQEEMQNLKKKEVERDVKMKNDEIEMQKKDTLLQSVLERMERLESLPVPLPPESLVRQDALDAMNQQQKVFRTEIASIASRLELGEEVFETRISGMEKLLKEKLERDVERNKEIIEMQEKNVLLQTRLRGRVKKLESLPVPPTALDGYVRQEDFDSTIQQ